MDRNAGNNRTHGDPGDSGIYPGIPGMEGMEKKGDEKMKLKEYNVCVEDGKVAYAG